MLLERAEGISLNADKFFVEGKKGTVYLPNDLFPIAANIIDKYGEDGCNALIAFAGEAPPLRKYQTKKFFLAFKELQKKVTTD